MNNYIIWKDVVGYEKEYEVSNTGLIRTKEGKTTHTEHHGKRVWKQRILKQKVDKEKSCRVDLWKDGKHSTQLVHRLVAKSFISEINGKNCINHKDGNRLNNFVENLEWNTYKENQNHAFDNDLTTTNHKIKLTKISNGEEFHFRSKSKAGQFLNRSDGYISLRLKRGHKQADGYTISEVAH